LFSELLETRARPDLLDVEKRLSHEKRTITSRTIINSTRRAEHLRQHSRISDDLIPRDVFITYSSPYVYKINTTTHFTLHWYQCLGETQLTRQLTDIPTPGLPSLGPVNSWTGQLPGAEAMYYILNTSAAATTSCAHKRSKIYILTRSSAAAERSSDA